MRDNSLYLLELVDNDLPEGVGRQAVDEEVCRRVDDGEETNELIEDKDDTGGLGIGHVVGQHEGLGQCHGQ